MDDAIDIDECEYEALTATGCIFSDTLQVIFNANGGRTKGMKFREALLTHRKLNTDDERRGEVRRETKHKQQKKETITMRKRNDGE